MEIQELIAMVTEGLPAEQAATVRAAIERDNVKSKVSTIKAQKDFDAIVQEQQRFQQELEGANGQPGSRAYKEWYDKNWKAIEANDLAIKKYEEKNGVGSFARALAGEAVTPPAGGKTLSEDDIQRMVDARIQGQYAPRWSELLTSTGSIVQKHMFAGRKKPIDFKELSKIAQEKTQGDIDRAYDIWDEPERTAAAKKAEDDRVDQRVKEELQKRGASASFPSGADLTPSTLGVKTKDETSKFDRTNLNRELAQSWMSGGAETTQ